MRLLHTKDIRLEEFYDTAIPRYAILSHRWGDTEVSFKDIKKGRASDGPGLRKIENCCKLAASRGHGWVWIDTCCIDKKSSAELSEAINSMFQWYRGAGECFVYLYDIKKRGLRKFRESDWFTRGWTLQELLAPRTLIFFDSAWDKIGDKDDLADEITAATDIKREYLLSRTIRHACVAVRMSWASKRQTSRSEDQAYCLLGLFEVNMPLLYGEGSKKAFFRLQIAILSQKDDETIFAWTLANGSLSGMLAPGPECFANSGDVQIRTPFHGDKDRAPILMTGKGLQFQLISYGWMKKDSRSLKTTLDVCKAGTDHPLILILLAPAGGSRKFDRMHSGEMEFDTIFPGHQKPKTIFVPQ